MTIPLPAFGADVTVSTTNTSAQTLNAGDTLTVTGAGKVSANHDPAVTVNGGASPITITNSGTIETTVSDGSAPRAIRLTGGSTENVTITNNQGAVIQSDGDTIQSKNDISAGTVSIINAGTIQSLGVDNNNGQAIDFNNIASGTATVTVTNLATGVISAADSDAIRPSSNGVVNNYGLIISHNGTPTSSGNDGIDFQSFGGTVNNFAGGTISGARHGITGDLPVTVFNAGTIIGNDGSGINLDTLGNTTTSITNRGTIIGTAKSADGDGIDVDGLVTINNYGIVRANGFSATGDLSEGLAIGGGTVNNYGLIVSSQRAITVDDSALGPAFGPVTIYNAGTIQGGDGEAIKITSAAGTVNTLTNAGTIIGSVMMGGGNDTVNIQAGSKITGLVDGEGGTDTLNYQKVGLTAAKEAALAAGQTVNIGGTLYTGFEDFTGSTLRSFSSFATNAQTSQVASILDNGSNTHAAGVGLQTVIDQVASASDVNAALAQLTPTDFQGLTTVGVNNALQTTQILDQRLSSVRAGGLAFDMSGINALAMLDADRSRGLAPDQLESSMGMATAYASTPAQNPAYAALDKAAGGGFTKAPRMLEGDSPWGAFLYGNAIFGRQNATQNSPESKFTATGVTGGIDRRITPNLVVGVLGGFTRTDADLDTHGSTSRIDTWLVGAYGTYYIKNWFVNGAFVYGHNAYDNSRVALGRVNTSNPDGNQYAVQGSVGADFSVGGNWIVTPELGLQYTTVRVDGFTENGAAALNVEADQADSLRSSLGARFRYQWQTAWGLLMPELRASWQHEFLDQDRDLRASFVDQALPGTFSTTAAGSGTDFGVFGTGLSATLTPTTQISLDYDYKFGGEDFSAHQISGRLRQLF